MDIIIGGRGSERITELIKACAADPGSVIVSPNNFMKHYAMSMAKQLGLDIPEPILFSALVRGNPYTFGRQPTRYYVDNLDLALNSCVGAQIKAATIEGQLEDILWLDQTQN